MRRQIRGLVVSLFAMALLTSTGFAVPSTRAATIAPTTTCSNGVDNTPGLGIICEVTVANTITASGGSASVTVRECHGAAGDPEASCSTTTDTLSAPVTNVTQCNDATNGGGGTLRCSVEFTNQFIDVTSAESAVTINQCVGSGDGIANTCDPFPSTTSGATITQCNGSANGGTLVELTCTATGTEASALPLTIDQCNGSTNGGGALVICSASVTNTFAAPPAPSDSVTPGSSTAVTPPPTDTSDVVRPAGSPGNVVGLVILLIMVSIGFVATSLAVGPARRR